MYPRLSSLQVTGQGCFCFFQVSGESCHLVYITVRRNLQPRSRLMFITSPISYPLIQSASELELVILNNNRWVIQFARESFLDHERVPRHSSGNES